MKKLLVFTLLCIAFFQGHTQNTDYYDRMEHVFGNIDKTKVTTGFLKEFGENDLNVSLYAAGHYCLKVIYGDVVETFRVIIN